MPSLIILLLGIVLGWFLHRLGIVPGSNFSARSRRDPKPMRESVSRTDRPKALGKAGAPKKLLPGDARGEVARSNLAERRIRWSPSRRIRKILRRMGILPKEDCQSASPPRSLILYRYEKREKLDLPKK